ncbi:MAG: Sir2 family NAD-dependent protein deacetylase [Verrucomicrobiota bacterium]
MTQIEQLAEKVMKSSHLTVLTGAGMSAESGVPTFQGPDGAFKGYPPEELANHKRFDLDPQLVWQWYDWRRQKIAACQPNMGHLVLAKLSRKPGFSLITQNVDGFHEKCGTQNVIRFHGCIWEMRRAYDQDEEPDIWWNDEVPLTAIPPLCPQTNKLCRPNVIWYGENINAEALAKSTLAASNCDVFITIGTSSVVRPAADLIELAKESGAFTAEINPEETPAENYIDLKIGATAVEALTALDGKIHA